MVRTLLCCTFFVLAIAEQTHGQVPTPDMKAIENHYDDKLSGADSRIFATNADLQQPDSLSVKELLVAIENWLMSQFALNSIDRHPCIEFAAPQKISALRYKPFLSDQAGQVTAADETATSKQQDTVAVYYDATQTIYLPKGWTGESPAEISVLVHEVVHHFQNLLGLKYECPPAREALAYLAQDQWLRLAGHDLATDFDLDPFTLLAKTKCLY